MSGDPAHDGGVFVIDLALDQPMAESKIVFRGWDERFPFRWRVESHVGEIQSGKDFSTAELIEGFAGQPFQNFAQQNETDIAIFRPGAGVSGEWNPERLPQ